MPYEIALVIPSRAYTSCNDGGGFAFSADFRRLFSAFLVVLTQSEPFDKSPKLNVDVVKPSGETEALQIEIPHNSLGGEIGFAYFPIRIFVETNGRYVLTVRSRGGSVSVPLKVSS